MKSRILRSVLLIAYIGLALSGQLGALQNNALSDSSVQSVNATLTQASK